MGRFELVYSDSDESDCDSHGNKTSRPSTRNALLSPVPAEKLNDLHYCQACDLYWDKHDRKALLGEAHDGSRMFIALDSMGSEHLTFWSKEQLPFVNAAVELKTIYLCERVAIESSKKQSTYGLHLSVAKSQLPYWLHSHERSDGHDRAQSDGSLPLDFSLESIPRLNTRIALQLWNNYNEKPFTFDEYGLQRVRLAYTRVFHPLRASTVQQLHGWRLQASQQQVDVEDLLAFRNSCLDANGVKQRELLEQILLWKQSASVHPGSKKRKRPLLTIGAEGETQEWDDSDDENQQLMRMRKKKTAA